MAGATLTAKVTGSAAQYQLTGTNGAATVTPQDTGTILGTVPPGKAGLKLVDGTVQNATALACDSTSGATGNTILPGQNAQGFLIESTVQAPSQGLSLAANHE